jgi:hypothetical protein
MKCAVLDRAYSLARRNAMPLALVMRMKPARQRGAALLMAIMMLSFLAIVGGALLTSVTLDARVSLIYRGSTQLLYLAESGAETGREMLRTSGLPSSALLAKAAGTDGVLATARDLDALLKSDDIPLVAGGDDFRGQYSVFLRNDIVDGPSNRVDTNDVLTLLSIARKGAWRKTIEITLLKKRPPKLPALVEPLNSGVVRLSGIDLSGTPDHAHAIGVVTSEDRDRILQSIPPGMESPFSGSGFPTPPPADVAVVEDIIASSLKTASGLERLTRDLNSAATDVYSPQLGATQTLGDIGSASDFRVIAVNGDCALVSGTGFGILVVRGVLTLAGNVNWTGVIFVIGQGEVQATGGIVRISGGLWLARTRDNQRDSNQPLGALLPERGPVTADFNALIGLSVETNRSAEDALSRILPYSPIAIREF